MAALRATLRDCGRVLVAFSGGVDSSFVLRVAVEELGENVIALTTKSPTAVDDDLVLAVALAEEWGVRHLIVDANELEIPGYAANPTNRCYFCKDRLYDICWTEATKLGIVHVVDGVNQDDLGDYRPGLPSGKRKGGAPPARRGRSQQSGDPQCEPGARASDVGQAVQSVPLVTLSLRHRDHARGVAPRRCGGARAASARFPRVPGALSRSDRAGRGAGAGSRPVGQ
jgi:hypothetical protein